MVNPTETNQTNDPEALTSKNLFWGIITSGTLLSSFFFALEKLPHLAQTLEQHPYLTRAEVLLACGLLFCLATSISSSNNTKTE